MEKWAFFRRGSTDYRRRGRRELYSKFRKKNTESKDFRQKKREAEAPKS